jgi:hypothetical protein
MYPHERSLVKRLKDKPFALLGVNVGDKPDLLKKLVGDGTITWRFFMDTRGLISERYRVKGFPTLMLLDHRGVIRATDIFDLEDLDAQIETLLKEMQGEKVAAGTE